MYSVKPLLDPLQVQTMSICKKCAGRSSGEGSSDSWIASLIFRLLLTSITIIKKNSHLLKHWAKCAKLTHLLCNYWELGICGFFREYTEENILRSLFPWMIEWRKEIICIYIPVHLWRGLTVRQTCVNILTNTAREKHWQIFLKCQRHSARHFHYLINDTFSFDLLSVQESTHT